MLKLEMKNEIMLDEVVILKNELEVYKNSLIEYERRLPLVSFKWEKDKVIYSYLNQGYPTDEDELVEFEKELDNEQKSIIDSFNKLIDYYEKKNYKK